MNITYRKLTTEDLDIFMQLRINQLKEEGAKEHGCGTVQVTASDAGVRLYTAYGFTQNRNFMQLGIPS